MRQHNVYKKTDRILKKSKILFWIIFIIFVLFMIYHSNYQEKLSDHTQHLSEKTQHILLKLNAENTPNTKDNPIDPASLIDGLIKGLLSGLNKLFFGWINGFVIRVLILPALLIINAIYTVLIKFSSDGILTSLFNGKAFDVYQLPYSFWASLIVIPLALTLIFMFHFFSQIDMDSSTSLGERFKRSGIGSLKMVLYIFTIPVGFFLLGALVNVGVFYINRFLTPEASNSTNEYYQNYVLTDEIAKLCGLSIDNNQTEILLRYRQGDLINSGTSVAFVASLIMTVIIAIFIVLIFLSLIERLFYIFMGIIFCVYFACSHALDGGSRWKEYRNSLVAKSFAIMIIIVTLNHAPWLAKRLDNVIDLKTEASGFLSLLVLLACLLSVMKIAGVVESKIGESSNYDRISGNSRKNTATSIKGMSNVMKVVSKTRPVGAGARLTEGVFGEK